MLGAGVMADAQTQIKLGPRRGSSSRVPNNPHRIFYTAVPPRTPSTSPRSNLSTPHYFLGSFRSLHRERVMKRAGHHPGIGSVTRLTGVDPAVNRGAFQPSSGLVLESASKSDRNRMVAAMLLVHILRAETTIWITTSPAIERPSFQKRGAFFVCRSDSGNPWRPPSG